MNKVCPFKDFEGNTLYEGDYIRHPDGCVAKVVYVKYGRRGLNWFGDYGDRPLSNLALQVGEKGRAVRIIF